MKNNKTRNHIKQHKGKSKTTTTKNTKIKSKRMKKRMKKTRKRVYSRKDYNSGDGMLTSIWGPSMWHYMHVMSFNYPVHPTQQQKKQYRNFILNLQHVLPCKHCRQNLKNNFKVLPLTMEVMKNRNSFSRYIYKLHELVNKMLGKTSGLSFCDVRERYEHFRSRCTEEKPKLFDIQKMRKTLKRRKFKKEKGCTEPLYGKKAKAVIKIMPHDIKCDSIEIDAQCIKERL